LDFKKKNHVYEVKLTKCKTSSKFCQGFIWVGISIIFFRQRKRASRAKGMSAT
jgi:hypothetical protein